jgi:NADH pyrophosphatase NudC (nudix superfamily)
MLVPVQTFFENLTVKSCSECGQPLQEQADCYQNHCDSCVGTEYYPCSPNQEQV